MSKLVLICLVAACLSSSAFADGYTKKKKKTQTQPTPVAAAPLTSDLTHHKMAGCGLGSIAIKDSDKWSQVGAAFLNGTGSQTFGISFGTSNCTENGLAEASREKEAFIEANYADLQRDAAAGQGEYLASLASLYGCKGSNSMSSFAASVKQSQVFQVRDADAAAAALEKSFESNAALANSCQG